MSNTKHIVKVRQVISEPLKKGWNYAHYQNIFTMEDTLEQCCPRSKPCYNCGDGSDGIRKNNYADAPASRWKRQAKVVPEAFE